MPVTLLLLGRDGNGKSSTGNSILGMKYFKPRSSSESGAGEILSRSTVIDGKEITVVDGPGIGDTNLNDPEDVQLTLQDANKAMGLCSLGFTAVIIIFKYGVRFTQQEKDTVRLIRAIFGESVFKDYGVVVMTHGDSFNMDNEEEHTTFEVWCRSQTGDLKDLFNECSNRYLLFNNRAKDEWSLRIQRDLLLATVAKIQARTNPYTRDDYMKAVIGRTSMTVFGKKSRLEGETKRVLGEITNSLARIDVYGSPELSIEKISELRRKIDSLKELLETEAKGTDIMRALMVPVRVSESILEAKLKLAEQALRHPESEVIQHANEESPFMAGREHEVDCLQAMKETAICFLQCVVYVCRRIGQFCGQLWQ